MIWRKVKTLPREVFGVECCSIFYYLDYAGEDSGLNNMSTSFSIDRPENLDDLDKAHCNIAVETFMTDVYDQLHPSQLGCQ